MEEFSPDGLPRRIRTKIRPAENGCWVWTGRLNTGGYGGIHLGRHQLAHRVVWILLVGEIPDGLTLDHLCCTPEECAGGPTCPHRGCVNPAHLTPATIGENVLRGNGLTARFARASACKRGHALTPENTYTPPGRGGRLCRICQREREIRRAPRSRRSR